MDAAKRGPATLAMALALEETSDPLARSDLLFLEEWARCGTPGLAAALRIRQIRRANPELAAAVTREMSKLS
jgi:hypothetical protein